MNKKTVKSGSTPGSGSVQVAGGIHALVGYQLALSTAVLSPVYFREVGLPMQMGRIEFTILNLVDLTDGMTPTQISQAISIKTSNITVAVDKLAARGLLVREKSLRDGRAQHLRLTAQGKELVKDALVRLKKAEEVAMSHLSPGERLMLLELLSKLALPPPGATHTAPAG
ncbi:MarR family transcriptional regulator [Rhodoferax sp. GW822-FHT02A01]|uniref:MarR family winged helix-turn-helix transcriptional regulator n=1 Tax=Rhodoferax sp. GW822-FHT02A01 TaxID=3141537 RepID=UPI00315CB1CF